MVIIKRVIKVLPLVGLLLLIHQQIYSQKTQSFDSNDLRYQHNIFYAGTNDTLQSLDVYWNSKSKNVSVLVFVHGGGWLSGDKKQYRGMASYLASNGLTVVLVDYRLSPKVKFPYHIEDVAAAINWVKDSIESYNGKKENIYLMGHSAGGQLITLLMFDKTYLKKYGIVPNDIAGVITISGVFEIKPQEGGATKKYLGMVFGENEKIWRQATCKTHINTNMKNLVPPFLISWGSKENELIMNESLNIIEELKAHEVSYQSFLFDNNNHYAFKDDLMNTGSRFYKNVVEFIDK